MQCKSFLLSIALKISHSGQIDCSKLHQLLYIFDWNPYDMVDVSFNFDWKIGMH